MIAKLQRLHHKKGFTLTELIIVIAILAVIVTAVCAFSVPVQRMVRATSAGSDAINANTIIGDYIEGRLEFANYIYGMYAVDSSSTAIPAKCTELLGKAALADKREGGKNGQLGALVFRYVPDASEPYKSSYELFDIPLTASVSGDTYSFSGNYPLPGDMLDTYRVFSQDFYGTETQRIFLFNKVNKGSTRGNTSLSIDIDTYRCDQDYYNSDLYVKSGMLQGHYKSVKGIETTDPTDAILPLKTGPTETVSFRLNNYKLAVFIPGFVVPGETSAGAGAGDNNDIVIFYYVPKYSA